MRFDIGLRHLARAFLDAQNLSLDAADLKTFAEEINAAPDPNTALAATPLSPVPRPALVWAGMEWQLAFLGESFDLVRNGKAPSGENLADVAGFARTAADILVSATRRFGRIPYRLALVQEGLMGEMTGEQLDAIVGRLLKVPSGFESPFEWTWRCGKRDTIAINGASEELNIIATLKRMTGSLPADEGSKSFDRIHVEFDVNTVPTNTRGRFYENEIRAFFDSALNIHQSLETMVRPLVENE